MKLAHRFAVLLTSAILAVFTFAAPARGSVITFEGFADGTVLTNQDFGNGVTFAGATILMAGGLLNDAEFPPRSGVNVVYNPGPDDMTLLFTNPVDFFNGHFTYNSGLMISAYDSLNNFLTSATGACAGNYVSSGCGTPNEFLQVSDPGLISKVIIQGGFGNNFTLDDASFTGSQDPGAAVPEPASLTLLGLGLAGMGARRWRQRKA